VAVAEFGLGLPVVQQVPAFGGAWERDAGGAEIVRFAREADRLGYRYVACSDHVLVAASRAAVMGATWYEPVATLGFVAGATERIGLLSHVLVLPYRHPLEVAKAWGTLDRLSGGRVILGVGSGHAKPEFRILGAPWEERGRATDEAIAAVRSAWRDEVATFEGEEVRFRNVMVAPRPARFGGPPVWVGGNGPRALRRAALLGDGWIPWQIDAATFAAAVGEGIRMRDEAGREDPFDWVAPLRVKAADTAASLLDAIAVLRDAGATGFHVGLEAPSFAAMLERLAWLADEVASRA
jgi:probable F420-dependent oxidoreductase